jgi:hypothetical protein
MDSFLRFGCHRHFEKCHESKRKDVQFCTVEPSAMAERMASIMTGASEAQDALRSLTNRPDAA